MNRSKVLIKLSLCLVLGVLSVSQSALAAPPVVNTTISVDKTGSEPFDSTTWTNPDLTTAGTDEDADNNVVRLQDSITYKVEVSVNDSDVGDLTATVRLLNKQVWINIPTGCKVDPADVTAQPVSSISPDGTEMFCNLGPAIEGTNKVFFPPARVVGVDPISGDITLNNDVVNAQVEAGADGMNNLASDGDTEVIVTAFFRVDTIKEPKVNATDPDTGAWLYRPVPKTGPNGEAGTLMEYRITARYVKGSMIADSDEITFEADYDLFDFYSDDNSNNNAAMIPTPNPPATGPLAGPFSTGGILYTWDAATPACSLDGNHGANALVTCIQNNSTPSDFTSPSAPVGGYAGDGLNDPTVDIDLDNIDVRDPDGDGNLFEVVINIWFNNATDIRNHQDCSGGTCINTVLQDIGALDAGGNIVGFNPESTEDASSNNLQNYNGSGEPLPNRIIFPLSQARPGSYVTHKTFDRFASSNPSKFQDQNVAAGSIKTVSLEVYDYRLVDGSQSQICDKIDTSVYEFAGLSSGASRMNSSLSNRGTFPINLWNWQNGVGSSFVFNDGAQYATVLYSDLPYTDAAGNPLTPGTPTGSSAADENPVNLAWHEAIRDSLCPDDLNNDGTINIKPAGAPEPFPALPIDWYEDANEMPGGQAATTRFRGEVTYNGPDMLAINPAHDRWAMNFEVDLRVKLLSAGYGDRNMLPNWMASRRTQTSNPTAYEANWSNETQALDDLDFVNFATTTRHSDRNILVPSGHSIEKYTNPRGIKVVRAGDVVQFVVEPAVFGLWDSSINTARIIDNLPNGSIYQAGSEEFSVDGGVTWLTPAAYEALGIMTITTAPNAGGADPLRWTFGSVDTGEQLPLIRYNVEMDASLVRGNFTNTATIISGLDVNKSQRYTLTILPEFGLDVVKTIDYPVFEVNEPFEFDLIYKNLGGEAYAMGRFIDVLPFVGDGAGGTGGLASDRDPASGFAGTFELTRVTRSNGETIFATNRPSAQVSNDPCHEDNLAAGYVPSLPTELCFDYYTNAIVNPPKPANTFVGGGAAGTGLTVWTQCTALNPVACGALTPEEITAIRIDVPTLQTNGGKTVSVELTPLGNLGGTPNLDALDNVTTAATGDIYTNTFGGRVPDISLNVISNDVSVTVVNGSIGNYVWWDAGADGVQENDPIAGVAVALLDGAGNPIFVDPATGGIVDSTTPGAIPYTTTTNAMGLYLFENLPSGTYQVSVTPPPNSFQTFDNDGLGTPNISTHQLQRENDSFGRLADVEDNDEQDFGYARNPLLTLVKMLDNTGGGTATLADFPLTYNNGGSAFGTGVSGTAPVTNVAVPVGTYMITESSAADYNASAFVCVGGSDTVAADGLNLGAFEEVTCTITNTFVPAPELTTLKGVDTSALQSPPMDGDTLTYTITVENTGNVPITGMTVNDAKLGGDITGNCVFPISAAAGLLIGEIATCTVTYNITQDDIDAGGVTNTATGAGLDPSGGGVMDVSDSTQPADDTGGESDPTFVPLEQDPSLAIDKSLLSLVGPPPASTPNVYDEGSVATYNYVVTNDGNTTISGPITVDDDRIASVSCPAGDLAPNASLTCTGTYTVTLDDVDLGSITNNADASGDGVTSPPDDVTIPTGVDPALTMEKSVVPATDTISFVGEVVTYNYLITNSGSAPFTRIITITDDQIGTFDCWVPGAIPGDNTFTVGEQFTCSNTYTVTQADLDAGEVTNVATANTTFGSSDIPVGSPSDTVTVDAEQNPAWTLVKSTLDEPTRAGDTLTYTFVLTNTGNVTINNVALSDPKCDGAITLDTASVAVDTTLEVFYNVDGTRGDGEVHTYSCTSIAVTQDEVNNGLVENTVTATGDPAGGTLDDLDAELDTPIEPEPLIALVKDSVLDPGADGIVNPGDVITYTYVVENTGNVTIFNVAINESNAPPMSFSGTGTLPVPVYQSGGADLDGGVGTPTDIDPNETVTFTATYEITQDDINAGEVINSAQAVGQDPSGGDVDDLSDSGDPSDPGTTEDDPTVELLPQTGEIELVKSSLINDGGDGIVNAGDTITYTYVVENTGTVSVFNVVVTENPASFTGDAAFLSPAVYLSGGSDLDGGGTTTDINPAETVTFTATYTIQQSDVDRGSVVNQAEANGESPVGPLDDVSDSGNPADEAGTDEDPTMSLFDPAPEIGSTKSASVGAILADGTFNVTYTIVVENTGNVTLSPLTLTDNLPSPDQLDGAFNGVVTPPVVLPGVIVSSTLPTANDPGYDGTNNLIVGTDGSLVPGESYQVVFTVNVDPNVSNPGFQNMATAGGTSPSGDNVVDDTNTGTDEDGNTTGETPSDNPGGPGVPTPIVPPLSSPELEVIKNGTLNSDGTIDYVITVENIGNVNVTDIVVDDPVVGAVSYAVADDADSDQDIDLLIPGASATVTATYTLTADDIAAGEVVNTATATGQDPSGSDVEDASDSGNPADDSGAGNDPTVTPYDPPSIGIAKDLKAGSPVDLGGGIYQVTYQFVVSNTGPFDLTNVQVTDDLNAMMNTPNPNNASYSNPVVSSPNGTLTPNSAYDGGSVQTMLSGTDTLLVGEVGLIELTFEFEPDVYFGPFFNQVVATADGPTGDAVSDLSEDGPSVNADSESPTPFSITTPSTPITLGWFRTELTGGFVMFEWATEVEVSNAGFHLSVRDEQGIWQRINPSLVPSKGDSVDVQRYRYEASDLAGTTFLITDVSVTGKQVDHGPFELGQSYGIESERKKTNWSEIEDESEAKRMQREAERRKQTQDRLRKLSEPGGDQSRRSDETTEQGQVNASKPSFLARLAGVLLSALVAPTQAAELVSFEVEEAGLFKVTHSQLMAQGLDLRGIDVSRIGLKQNNQLWPLKVMPESETEFLATSSIMFPGTGVDTLYTGKNKYVLVIDEGRKMIDVDDSAMPSNTALAQSYLAQKRYAPDNHYTHISPNEQDAWYADSLRAFNGEASKQVTLSVTDYAPALNSSLGFGNLARMKPLRPRLEVELWGNSNLPGNGLERPDHHVLLDVNGERLNSVRFDGLHVAKTRDVVTNMRHGNNSVKVTLPKDHGYQFDLVNLNSITLRYPRLFKAERAGKSLEFESDWNFFRVTDLASNSVMVVRLDQAVSGEPSAVEMTARGTGQCTSGCAYFAGSSPDQTSQYFVATSAGYKTPAIVPLADRVDIVSGQAKYLIIAHPDFIETNTLSLESYASELAGIYGSADIVDVESIYAQYSGHVFDAEAIHSYIKEAYRDRGTRHVMLVGGDMYDYRNNLGTNSRSFIPSLYVPIANNVNSVPSDASYADVNDDFIPDMTIARLPVRTDAELSNLLSKRQRYIARNFQKTAVFAADKLDGSGYSFKADSQRMLSNHFGNWSAREVYLDDVSISQGKAQIVSGLDAGSVLTSYFGHSSTDRWAISGLFTGADVSSLSNASRPTVIAQWGCWNTFYTSPEQDSLAHRLLVESNVGAVTVMGATSFTKASAEEKMADLLYARLSQGMRLGDAVLSAKQALAVDYPYQLDVLLGWAVLGPDDMTILEQ